MPTIRPVVIECWASRDGGKHATGGMLSWDKPTKPRGGFMWEAPPGESLEEWIESTEHPVTWTWLKALRGGSKRRTRITVEFLEDE